MAGARRPNGAYPAPAAARRVQKQIMTGGGRNTQTTRGLLPPRSVAQRAGRTNRQPAGRVTAWDWPAAHLQYALVRRCTSGEATGR